VVRPKGPSLLELKKSLEVKVMTEAVSCLSERSDRELVEACLAAEQVSAPPEMAAEISRVNPQSGDQVNLDINDAWEALIRRYERLIYSVPIRLGMSAEQAVDVFQSVCFIMFRKLRSLRNQERIYSWLITTTTRECWRIWSERTRTYDREKSLPLQGGWVSPEQLAIERHLLEQHRTALKAALAELSPKCRELITALYLANDEASYESVAKWMSMPVSSIGPTRGRCLRKLKKLFEQKITAI
jgi:RNA polymerase sigma factor (sigma-70 family)